MIDHNASARYAKALFHLAEERNELERIDTDFKRVRDTVARYPEITHLALNSTISQAEKEDFVEKIFADSTDPVFRPVPLLLQFLKVLVKKRRFRELTDIQQEFHRLVERKQGIREVRAITATPLSAGTRERIKNVLKEKLKADIRLVTETEPELIGGLILRFEGSEIDASVRSRLAELKQKLMAS